MDRKRDPVQAMRDIHSPPLQLHLVVDGSEPGPTDPMRVVPQSDDDTAVLRGLGFYSAYLHLDGPQWRILVASCWARSIPITIRLNWPPLA